MPRQRGGRKGEEEKEGRLRRGGYYQLLGNGERARRASGHAAREKGRGGSQCARNPSNVEVRRRGLGRGTVEGKGVEGKQHDMGHGGKSV